MKLSASNDNSMIFQGTVEEWNKKIPHFKTLLSLTCLHTNALKFYLVILNFVKILFQYGNYKEIPSWKENCHLTKYSWRIHQLSSVTTNFHPSFELILAISHLVNSWHLWFLCRTIIDEQSASKTEKNIDYGNVISQKGGVPQYTHKPYGRREKKGHAQIAWKLEETVWIT